jgi:hypothetical protein
MPGRRPDRVAHVRFTSQMDLFPRYVRPSLPRLWIRDAIYFGMRHYINGMSQRINIAPLMKARNEYSSGISWMAIYIKALALVGQRFPELRQSFLPWPWPRIYQHPNCVALPVIERQWRGEDAVLFDPILAPESMPLPKINDRMRQLRNLPVEAVGGYRRLIRITRLPRPLRRALWRLVLHWSGRLRSQYAGTFMVTSLAIPGIAPVQAMMPASIMVYYSAPESNGDVMLYVFLDHRLIDGMRMYRLLLDLETTLNGAIVEELAMSGARDARNILA